MSLMKKGCFIKSVIAITILVGIVVYIVQYKLEEWLTEPANYLQITQLAENWDTKANFIRNSIQKDSLGVLLSSYFSNVESMEDVVNWEEDLFLIGLQDAIDDSLITTDEISKLTLLLKKEKNEKSTINRN
jgi:predicted nucleic-acid-binding protein